MLMTSLAPCPKPSGVSVRSSGITGLPHLPVRRTGEESPRASYWTRPMIWRDLLPAALRSPLMRGNSFIRADLTSPFLGTPGIAPPDRRCRRCKVDIKTTAHVTSHCRVNLASIGRRHDEVLGEIVCSIRKAGHVIQVNQVFRESSLRPDNVVSSITPPTIINLTIPFDASESLVAGYNRKVKKYGKLGPTIPFVIGGLGSWLPSNNSITGALGIRPGSWTALRRRTVVLAWNDPHVLLLYPYHSNKFSNDQTRNSCIALHCIALH
jgi:hypothetical protein